MEVRVLKDEVVNKIAAGEVVERPASVVRELVDNALDAGATDVLVRIESGGRSLIEVSDNGKGMSRDDALLCFERHATSKLRTESDLNDIHTLGFRGEALSSIASISKVTLSTRREQDELGTEVQIDGGKIRSVKSVPCRVGTSVRVRRIFFNTPARRKFLRTPQTEEKRIRAWMNSAVLAFPTVRFRLHSDEKEVLNYPSRKTLMGRAKLMHSGSYVELEGHKADCSVCGLVSHPGLAQRDSNSLTVLVNGRVVRDSLVVRAVRDGFASTLKSQEYPIGFISLIVDPSLVDVNVHPQKTEVRFHDNALIFALVRDSVASAVRNFRFPVSDASRQAHFERNTDISDSSHRETEETFTRQAPLAFSGFAADSDDHPGITIRQEAKGYVPPKSEDLKVVRDAPTAIPIQREKFSFSNLRYIGQALGCYLFCEREGRIYVIDMHAAHERVNYERIRAEYVDKSISSQTLLAPLSVSLTPGGLEACLTQQQFLERFGFLFESFGDDTLLVRAAPSMLRGNVVADLIKELAALLTEHEDVLRESAAQAMSQMLDRVCARLACHASVRSGKAMTKEESYALLAKLDEAEFSSACPHGRPIIVSFSQGEVEKWFGRDR